MHASVMRWATRVISEHRLDQAGCVIEIGSHNVNGSLRSLFPDVEYTGYDLQEGNGVDVVVRNASEIQLPPHSVDGIVCTEVLEHDPQFWLTLQVIGTLLRKDGWLILTARGARANGKAMFEHDFPHDYWRFMPQSVELLMEMASCNIIEDRQDKEHPGFMALGRKR